jgi:hypothetical protein
MTRIKSGFFRVIRVYLFRNRLHLFDSFLQNHLNIPAISVKARGLPITFA